MPPTRDPFPYPRYENEDTFTGRARSGQVPRDSLDFKLTSLYNHHKEQLRDKSQIVIHKETLLDVHGALKGLEPVKEPELPPVEHRTARGLSMRCWVSPTKESIHSIEGAIECPHTAATNSGYSRKENGSFFSQ
ncbi:cilia- and flagella-associated protein 276 isoform X2 [Malaclemys terrapin pileata]|nr:protein C1orf194 homolog isoform X2 [Chrysemys picta bellii]XP_053882774.1 cilia- and flagella-associated protein 276 isoform X2 [Malaclemys terrapin pileata]